jgi:hypothetical protein
MRVFSAPIVLLTSMIILSGCGGGATVSQNQCIASDWQTLGYRDGVNGIRSSQLLKHQDACVKHGIIPDRAGYMTGWNDGVGEYCQPNNAFEIGELGGGHDNVCPREMQTTFTTAYRQGRKLYLARVEIANLERAIGHKEHRLEDIKAELVSSATGQLNPLLTTADRVELLARTHRLTEERHRLKTELPPLIDELADRQIALDSMRQTLASVVY